MSRRIVVPLDGSELSERAVETAADLLDREGTLVLIRVLEFPQIGVWAPIDAVVAHQEEEKMVRTYLEGLKAKWSDRGFAVETHMHPGPSPAHAVVDTADKEKADLIVMSSHGRTGFARFMLGSVAEKVVRLCHTPIYILKPTDQK